MIANVKARYTNGVFTPLEPLDLEEGAEVALTVEETTKMAKEPTGSLMPMLERVKQIQATFPPEAWNGLPADGAKNYKHYLYGHPKEKE